MIKKSAVLVVPSMLVLVMVWWIGHWVRLKLGSEALNAWGAYLTGAATLVLSGAAILGGFQALREYRAKVTADKAKWLLQLYEKFFENLQYKEIRRQIDFDDMDEIKTLIKADSENKPFTVEQQKKFDHFTDYLNFFELIAHLKAVDQLTSEDIKATFEYYLRLLTREKHPEIRGYLAKAGFENLDKLVDEYEG